MYRCPINYFADNLIFNADKSCWAAYKLAGYDYDFLDDSVKISMLYKMAKFLAGIMSDAQILIVPVEQDSDEQFKSIKKRLDPGDPLYARADYHASQTLNYLIQVKASKGEANDYSSYIIVKLADYTESELAAGLREGYQYFLKDPVNAINVFMNLDTKDILMSKMNSCIRTAEKWWYAQNQKIRLVALNGMETQWLFRRMTYRGTGRAVPLFWQNTRGNLDWKPGAQVKEIGGDRIIKPYCKDIVNLFSGSIHSENRLLRIEHDRGVVSYQSFLALTNIPDSFEYPGMEWIYMLQQYNLQAEVCIHIRAVDFRRAQRKLDVKKREIESQMEHIVGASADIPEDLLSGKAYAEAMEAELKDLKEPILNTSVTICIAAGDKEELEKKVSTVKNEYEDMNFGIERPLADQLKLFMQGIPSVGCIVRDYTMPITPLTLASGVIGASHELGDRVGPYIGTTGLEEKQVFLDMGQACLRNKSASATFYGNLGVGKSFNANLLLVLNVLYGGYGLIFDPKAERSHWESEMAILEGMITTVTLSGDPANKGKLDPYNLYREDRKLADELAANVVSELLKISPTSMEYTAVLEAQRMMGEEKEVMPSMKRLVELLGMFPASDELHNAGKLLSRRLGLQADSGMAQLLFGDGSEDAISLENRLNILQIDNLKLPSPETAKEEYTTEETLSTVLMAVISNFARKFAMVKRPVFKTILFDESWMLGKTAEGVKLYDFLTRMGRSLYTGCIFNGHSVLDLPSEGIRNTISYKFCFQTTNDAEASRMCKYMGLEATASNRDTLKNLRNGECLFQDLDGHIGVLKFDAVFQDLIDVFSTTPKTAERKVELEEDVAEQMEGKQEELQRKLFQAAQNAQGEQPEEERDTIELQEEKENFTDLDFDFTEEELYRKEDI